MRRLLRLANAPHAIVHHARFSASQASGLERGDKREERQRCRQHEPCTYLQCSDQLRLSFPPQRALSVPAGPTRGRPPRRPKPTSRQTHPLAWTSSRRARHRGPSLSRTAWGDASAVPLPRQSSDHRDARERGGARCGGPDAEHRERENAPPPASMLASADMSASSFGIASGTRGASLDVTGPSGGPVPLGGRHGSCLWRVIMSDGRARGRRRKAAGHGRLAGPWVDEVFGNPARAHDPTPAAAERGL